MFPGSSVSATYWVHILFLIYLVMGSLRLADEAKTVASVDPR